MPWMAVVYSGMWRVEELLCALVGVDFEEADFYNVVGADIDSCGFEVEEDEGFLQVELHGVCCLLWLMRGFSWLLRRGGCAEGG